MLHKLILSFLLIPTLLLSFFLMPNKAYAATFRSDEAVLITQPESDLYAAGKTVRITAPITNDLTAAGETVQIEASVSGGLIVAGRTLSINGPVTNTVRAAGETIMLSAPIQRDAVLFGGTITLTEAASVSGDLVVNGGQISVQAPVAGDIIVNGGTVTINAPVGGNIQGNVETLILGTNARVGGDLNYSADKKATIRDGAVITGTENFKQITREKPEEHALAGILTSWSIYKLVADILVSLALIYLFYTFTKKIITRGQEEVVRNGITGIVGLILLPILGLFLLILIFPGIITFLLYGLLLIMAVFFSKLLVGTMILTWFYARENKTYILDWKAAIVGPLVMFILIFIPVIGWIIAFLLYILAFGSLIQEVYSWISSPKTTTPVAVKAPTRRKK